MFFFYNCFFLLDKNEDLNTAEEDLTNENDESERLRKFEGKFIEGYHHHKNTTHPQHLVQNCQDNNKNCTEEVKTHKHTKRHNRKRLQDIKKLQEELSETNFKRAKREKRESHYKLDGPIDHGGNAMNYSQKESEVSSFENDLLTCYDGQILVTQAFPPSHKCSDVNFVDKGVRMKIAHEINSDGYYYYIFYSDNDLVSNDIHAVFDIYKPTFQYTNASDTKQCVNQTECTFKISFFSGETVIVEVPTRDGIEHEPDDISQLVSVCKPRMLIYMIFPITILFLILGCAFL